MSSTLESSILWQTFAIIVLDVKDKGELSLLFRMADGFFLSERETLCTSYKLQISFLQRIYPDCFCPFGVEKKVLSQQNICEGK